MDDQLHEMMHKMDKKLEVLVFQTEEISKCINGNGKEGLKDKVNRMETENKTEIKTIKWIGGVISFALGLVAFLTNK